jgi:predicted GNAT family acetyltransferase
VLHKLEPSNESYAVEADPLKARTQMSFFVNVEKEFGRNHMTMNQLFKRIEDRKGNEEYLVCLEDDRYVAQGFVEDKLHAFWQIGGIYTLPSHRGKGLGRHIVTALCRTILEQGNLPILAVLKENQSAVSLYEKMGFEKSVDFSNIHIEF